MPFVPVLDTAMVEMRMSLHSQRVENTLYFELTAGSTISQGIELANDLLVWWTTTFSTPLSNDLTLREIQVTDLSSANGYSVTVTAPTPNPAGDVTIPALPGNCALCASFRTASRGRSFRGRNYVPGIPEDAAVGNQVTAPFAAAVLSAYQALAAGVTNESWQWVVVSRFTNNAPRVSGVTTPVLSVAIVDLHIDSMRRRLTGRGV